MELKQDVQFIDQQYIEEEKYEQLTPNPGRALRYIKQWRGEMKQLNPLAFEYFLELGTIFDDMISTQDFRLDPIVERCFVKILPKSNYSVPKQQTGMIGIKYVFWKKKLHGFLFENYQLKFVGFISLRFTHFKFCMIEGKRTSKLFILDNDDNNKNIEQKWWRKRRMVLNYGVAKFKYRDHATRILSIKGGELHYRLIAFEINGMLKIKCRVWCIDDSIIFHSNIILQIKQNVYKNMVSKIWTKEQYFSFNVGNGIQMEMMTQIPDYCFHSKCRKMLNRGEKDGFNKCKGCRVAKYCSRRCFKNDWHKGHRDWCKNKLLTYYSKRNKARYHEF